MKLFPRLNDNVIDVADRTLGLAPPFDLDITYLGITMPVNVTATTYPGVVVGGADLGTITSIGQNMYRYSNVPTISGQAEVTLTTPYANSEIRYTLNGRNPTPSSRLYDGVLVFKQNGSGSEHTAVKARIYSKDNSNVKSKIIRLEFRVVPG